MERQILQHFVVTSALFGLLLGTSLTQAQGKSPLRPMSHSPYNARRGVSLGSPLTAPRTLLFLPVML